MRRSDRQPNDSRRGTRLPGTWLAGTRRARSWWGGTRRGATGRLAGVVLAAGLLSVVLAACDDEGGGGSAAGSDDDAAEIHVLATTPLLADFARVIAAGAPDGPLRVDSLIPPGTDLHSFQPSPGGVRAITEADLVIVNGYGLEAGLLSVLGENLARDAVVVVAAAPVPPATGILPAAATAEEDPHRWLDAGRARGYVERIADALAMIDPARGDAYAAAATAYLADIDAVDAELRAAAERIPAERRVLVVFHDAYGFFAEAYGLRLLSDGGDSHHEGQEASATHVTEIIEEARAAGVTAVFAERQFDDDAVRLVAGEIGAQLGTLYSTLIPGEAATYLDLQRRNVAALELLAAAGAEPGS